MTLSLSDITAAEVVQLATAVAPALINAAADAVKEHEDAKAAEQPQPVKPAEAEQPKPVAESFAPAPAAAPEAAVGESLAPYKSALADFVIVDGMPPGVARNAAYKQAMNAARQLLAT